MSLEVGSRIAHYDVTALIGEGGMGQVYQATDTKLNRQVALKILPEAFATDPDWVNIPHGYLSRFVACSRTRYKVATHVRVDGRCNMERWLGVCRPFAFPLLVVLLTTAIPDPVMAQEPTSEVARSFQDLMTRVEPGTEVSVIDTAGTKVAGDVLNISASSLTLSLDDTQRELREVDVVRVTRPPHGMSRSKGGMDWVWSGLRSRSGNRGGVCRRQRLS